MAATSKIIIDADNGKVDQANKKTQEGFERTAKKAKTVGEEIGKWGGQLAAKTVGLGAILQAIRAIGQEATRQREQAVTASKTVGGGALGRAASIRELGLGGGATGAAGIENIFASGGGRATTSEQDDAFLAAAAAQQRSAKQKAKPEDIMRAISLMGSGVFSQEEVLGGLEKGDLANLMGQVGERTSALPQSARTELEVRRFERQQAGMADESRRQSGVVSRVQEARIMGRDAGLSGVAQGISELNKSANPFAFGGATENAINGAMGRDSAVLQQIANNTKNVPKPTMATTPESGP